MSNAQPTRNGDSLADVVELVLDKGVVINADIAVSIGDTELLGIQLRAAIASFDTAAEYGLEFPEGTDMQRVAEAAGTEEIADEKRKADDTDETDDTERIAIEQADEDGITEKATVDAENDGGSDDTD
ncbi:gas vesicle protein GvpJ [Halocatena salina]|uniref:Gas vesicle protein n=1 Tax=Halocatena salina TaxID=2934340 RepID=A0A8U0A881_9EURY|nr:gas vesicle protein [Halocatena salina]UPM45059.1 gas vesicle protein [Halocatena salina]